MPDHIQTPVQRLVKSLKRLLSASAAGRQNYLRLALNGLPKVEDVLADLNLEGNPAAVASEIVLRLNDAGSYERGKSYLCDLVEGLLVNVTDIYETSELREIAFSLSLVEQCRAELNARMAFDQMQEALQPVQPLIDASGLPGARKLEAYLTKLGIAQKAGIKALLAEHRERRGVNVGADQTVEERDASAVVSIQLAPAPADKGGECDIWIRCYPPRSREALEPESDEDGNILSLDGEGVQAEGHIERYLAPAIARLAEDSDDIRVEFVVPSEYLGNSFDRWQFKDRRQVRPIGSKYPVVVRWIENAISTTGHARLRRTAESNGVEWLPDTGNVNCPIVAKLERLLDLAQKKKDPQPLGLIISEKTVIFDSAYCEQIAYLGLTALWIRANGETEEVRSEIDEILCGLLDTERHFQLPIHIYFQRQEHPKGERIHLLWENPKHFVTVSESNKIMADSKRASIVN